MADGRYEMQDTRYQIPDVGWGDAGRKPEERPIRRDFRYLVLHFGSADDLEPFRVHPDHREYVDIFLKPRLEGIRGYNFES